MSSSVDYLSLAPETVRPLFDAAKVLAQSSLEQNLRVLIELRASQLNRCAFCLALHMREGKALGESDDRLFGLAAWRESPWYSERERAALEWTEALTLVAQAHPDAASQAKMREHFSEREMVYLTLAVNTINSWNRLNVAFGTSPEGAEAVFKTLHAQPATAHA